MKTEKIKHLDIAAELFREIEFKDEENIVKALESFAAYNSKIVEQNKELIECVKLAEISINSWVKHYPANVSKEDADFFDKAKQFLNFSIEIRHKCLWCGRDFNQRQPHRCNTGFRKRNMKWQVIRKVVDKKQQ